MKKIPTLFKKEFDGKKYLGVTNEVTPGMEWVLDGIGVATVKFDGACCAIIGGEFYKRYDAKRGKKPPENAIPCCEPDEVTGHWPHWVPVDENNPGDKWFVAAKKNSIGLDPYYSYQTFEAIGPHFKNNPYGLSEDVLVKHETQFIYESETTRSFESIRTFLEENEIEGIVYWKDRRPQCKIKRRDFGLQWPVKK